MVNYIGYWQDKGMKKGSPSSPIIFDCWRCNRGIWAESYWLSWVLTKGNGWAICGGYPCRLKVNRSDEFTEHPNQISITSVLKHFSSSPDFDYLDRIRSQSTLCYKYSYCKLKQIIFLRIICFSSGWVHPLLATISDSNPGKFKQSLYKLKLDSVTNRRRNSINDQFWGTFGLTSTV